MMHRSDFVSFWRAALRFSARLCASFGAPLSGSAPSCVPTSQATALRVCACLRRARREGVRMSRARTHPQAFPLGH
jgi:hypothetical protein